MLKTILSFLFLFIATTLLFAQDCGIYFSLTPATLYEYKVTRGEKRSPYGRFDYTIVSSEKSADGWKATMTIQQVKENGKNFEKPCTYAIHCSPKGVRVKPDSTDFPAMSLGALYLPADLQVGMSLPDELSSYYYDKRKPTKVNGGVALFNIKVTKKEQVTVPTGTYDAFLIEYDRTAKQGSVLLTANLISSIKIHVKDWYAEGKGLIKSERYMGKSLLVTLELASVKPNSVTAAR